MYPRTDYEMSEEDLKVLLEAIKPVPLMMIGGHSPSRQENANMAWKRLGKKMGFNHKTVRPIPGKGQRFFSAVPSENEVQRKERLKREAEDHRQSEIKRLKCQIKNLLSQLEKLVDEPVNSVIQP